MSKPKAEEPDYGNWVSRRLIYITGLPGFMFLAFFLASLILYAQGQAGSLAVILVLTSIVCLSLAVAFIVPFAYFTSARNKLSARGGNIQARIEELVSDHLNWSGKGRVLDIGCGNGPLSIALAKKFPNARVTGIDYWGGAWEYSKAVCETNARIEGVASRVKFQRASASHLPFEDASFDAAVSNLVFHEVKDVKDKRDAIKEALRILKRGGNFAFQDLFMRKRVYGEVDALVKEIRSWGIKEVRFADTHNSKFIPRSLRLSFMLGAIGIIYGKK